MCVSNIMKVKLNFTAYAISWHALVFQLPPYSLPPAFSPYPLPPILSPLPLPFPSPPPSSPLSPLPLPSPPTLSPCPPPPPTQSRQTFGTIRPTLAFWDSVSWGCPLPAPLLEGSPPCFNGTMVCSPQQHPPLSPHISRLLLEKWGSI